MKCLINTIAALSLSLSATQTLAVALDQVDNFDPDQIDFTCTNEDGSARAKGVITVGAEDIHGYRSAVVLFKMARVGDFASQLIWADGIAIGDRFFMRSGVIGQFADYDVGIDLRDGESSRVISLEGTCSRL